MTEKGAPFEPRAFCGKGKSGERLIMMIRLRVQEPETTSRMGPEICNMIVARQMNPWPAGFAFAYTATQAICIAVHIRSLHTGLFHHLSHHTKSGEKGKEKKKKVLLSAKRIT